MNYNDEEESADLKPVSYLKFSLHDEHFALPLLMVKEVIALPEVTSIPNTPKYFLGIMNLRGQIISIVDLRTKLNIQSQFNAETTVVICEMKPYCVGIVVDSVDNVLSLTNAEIKEKPKIESAGPTDYITGVVNKDNQLILIVDMIKALDMSDRELIANAERKAA
jgi:purine-binding chemotaxis protein CheW